MSPQNKRRSARTAASTWPQLVPRLCAGPGAAALQLHWDKSQSSWDLRSRAGAVWEAVLDYHFQQQPSIMLVSREGRNQDGSRRWFVIFKRCETYEGFHLKVRSRTLGTDGAPLPTTPSSKCTHSPGTCRTWDGNYKGALRRLSAHSLSCRAGVPQHSPLDTESQYNSIVTFQGLLALVCGTGIPHLTGNTRQQRVTCLHIQQLGAWAGCRQTTKARKGGNRLSSGHLCSCLPGRDKPV